MILAAISPTEILLLLLYVAVVIPLILGCLVLWVWTLVHCIRNEVISESSKIVWVVVICLTHVLGAVLYLLFGRRPHAGSGVAPVR